MYDLEASITQFHALTIFQFNVDWFHGFSIQLVYCDLSLRLLSDHLAPLNVVHVAMCEDKEAYLIWASTQFSEEWEEIVDWSVLETSIDQSNLRLSKDDDYSDETALAMDVLEEVEIIGDLLDVFHYESEKQFADLWIKVTRGAIATLEAK